MLQRCTIRPWQMHDAESLAKHANNRKVWLGLRDIFPHPYTLDDACEFLRKTITARPTTNFCIEVNGTAVGGIGVRPRQDERQHTAETGLLAGEDFWKRGIMTEAVAAFTVFCFKNFALRRISVEVFANNPASARVLEKNRLQLRRTLQEQCP